MTVTRADLMEGDENIKCEVMIPTLEEFKEMTNHGAPTVPSAGNRPEP